MFAGAIVLEGDCETFTQLFEQASFVLHERGCNKCIYKYYNDRDPATLAFFTNTPQCTTHPAFKMGTIQILVALPAEPNRPIKLVISNTARQIRRT